MGSSGGLALPPVCPLGVLYPSEPLGKFTWALVLFLSFLHGLCGFDLTNYKVSPGKPLGDRQKMLELSWLVDFLPHTGVRQHSEYTGRA